MTTDRPDALYRRGETVSFEIKWKNTTTEPAASFPREVHWRVSKDGVAPVREGTLSLKDGHATVTGSLDEPGFLQCKVTVVEGDVTHTAMAAAGIEPMQIKPSLPCPDDFDAFWTTQKKRLAAVPLKSRLTPVPLANEQDAHIEAFDVQVDCVGAPVSGYYARPASGRAGGYPARLYVDGAGVRSAHLFQAKDWARRDVISLAINAHGIPNAKPEAFYDELTKGALKLYRVEGRESRDTWYFLGMFLRVQRALDFLAAQPEWDGRTLIIEGGSQGGAQSMAGAALDPRVTFYTAIITAMCDHSGMVAGRIAGWPKIVPVKDGVPEAAVLEAARYFDMVNFAPRIKAKGYFWVGFVDVVCPPTSVYAAYNQVTAPKEMIHMITNGHNLDNTRLQAALVEVEQRHIAEQAVAVHAP
ncbi:acetylxylan esterase [Rariglobus hedericola]|uniref:acetylxylan esterase n=1 Tax=Rariglobus hedericola TaxID=2597822 RepID=UPI0013969A33|nr:acetylxylan esterase [Rariglobus hedericola]